MADAVVRDRVCVENCEKTWAKCAFRDSDTFQEDWNCGLVGKIRAILYAASDDYGSEVEERACLLRWDDCSTGAIVCPSEIGPPEVLVVGYYKNRGRTDWMKLIDHWGEERTPTADDLRRIAGHFAKAESIQSRAETPNR